MKESTRKKMMNLLKNVDPEVVKTKLATLKYITDLEEKLHMACDFALKEYMRHLLHGTSLEDLSRERAKTGNSVIKKQAEKAYKKGLLTKGTKSTEMSMKYSVESANEIISIILATIIKDVKGFEKIGKEFSEIKKSEDDDEANQAILDLLK